MTYLQLVNTVLRRMREKEVNSVSSTAYSRLIGDLINDVKNEVENSWDWNALRFTYVVNTTTGLFNYILVNAKAGTKILHAWNDTSKNELGMMTTVDAERKYLMERQTGAPFAYNVNGINVDGDYQVDVYPIPDALYALTFNAIVPQEDLSDDTDVLKIPSRVVIEGTIARAIQERGEDGGVPSELAYGRYQKALSDAIALDAAFHPDETTWYPA
jgi:hypothetical protein